MLKKSRRISRSDFNGFNRPLKSVKGDFFIARIFQLNPKIASKFAFSVSKKQEKSAVARNRIRRLGYVVLANYLPTIQNGIAVHFILQKRSEDPKRDINNDVRYILSKI